MKFLLLLVVLVVVVGVIVGRSRRRVPPPDDGAAAVPNRADASPEASRTPMVACAHCGLHVPEHESLQDERGHRYCGEEHRRLGSR